MKHVLLLAFAAVLMVSFMWPASAPAQIKVTFVVNTATVPDTIRSTSMVTVTGNKDSITNWWNGIQLENIGGDYWSKTIEFKTGDSLAFKFRVGGAWEGNLTGVDSYVTNDRSFVVGTRDTTLPVEFVNFTGDKQPQYWRPYPESADTVNIFFRVNMQGYTKPWNSAVDTIGIRGDRRSATGPYPSLAPDMAWGTTHYFTQESTPAGSGINYNGANFWHGVIRIPKTHLYGGDSIGYKFIINSDWGRSDDNDRLVVLPNPSRDTTVYWAFFNNQAPIRRDNTDTVVVTYVVDMTKSLLSGGFSIGDTVVVVEGDFGTMPAPKTIQLMQEVSAIYSVTDTVVTSRGKVLDYWYNTNINGALQNENYYNYFYTGETQSEAQRRQVTVPLTGDLVIYDTSTVFTDIHRQPDFKNVRKLLRPVAVAFEVDMRPAIYQVLKGDSLTDIQSSFTVRNADSVVAWGVSINGPATGTWAGWGASLWADTTRKMWDDGTHGDRIAHDTIYTRVIHLSPDSTQGSMMQVGQEFKFGIHGGDNEGGKGGFGNNHIENVVDATGNYILASQWGSMNPMFYNAWDYTAHKPTTTDVEMTPGVLPEVYSLSQNYPNPFNPATKIQYTLPKEGLVTLKVYNLLGQEVATLVNGVQRAARYTVTFDATNLASGVYFYKMTAGSYVSTMKMLVLK